MTTSLQRQLIALQAPASSLLAVDRKRTSIIFSSSEAAKFDHDTFYQIGLEGLKELNGINPRLFSQYFESMLFDEAAKSVERAVLDQETNDRLDGIINEFLVAISPFMMIKAPLKCMEWLVHRFHIEQFNLNAIMQCILPYYDTKTFALVIKVFEGEKFQKHPEWQWLLPSIQMGTPVPKSILFSNGNVKFIGWIFDTLSGFVKVHEAQIENLATYLAFLTSTLLGILNQFNQPVRTRQAKNVNSDRQVVVLSVWNHVLELLRSLQTPDALPFADSENLHSSLYMIITMLLILRKESPISTPGSVPVSEVINLVLRTYPHSLQKHTILLLNLAGSIDKVCSRVRFGKDAELRDRIIGAITELSEEMDVYFAARVVLMTLMSRNPRPTLSKFWEWIGGIQMSPQQKADLFCELYGVIKSHGSSKSFKDRFSGTEFILECERKYPIEFSLAAETLPEFTAALVKASRVSGVLDEHAVAEFRKKAVLKTIKKAKTALQEMNQKVSKKKNRGFPDAGKDTNKFALSLINRFDDDDKDVTLVLLKPKLQFMKQIFSPRMLIKAYSIVVRKRVDPKCTRLALKQLCRVGLNIKGDKDLLRQLLTVFIPFFLPLTQKEVKYARVILSSKFAKSNGFLSKFLHILDKSDLSHKQVCKLTFDVLMTDEPEVHSEHWVKEFEKDEESVSSLLLAVMTLRDGKGANALLGHMDKMVMGSYSSYPVKADDIFKQLKKTVKNKKLSLELVLSSFIKLDMDKELIRKVFTFALLRSEKTEYRHVSAMFIHQLLQKCFSRSSSLLEFWMTLIQSTRTEIQDPKVSEYLLIRLLQFLANIFEKLATTAVKDGPVEKVKAMEPPLPSTPARNTRSSSKGPIEPMELPSRPRSSRVDSAASTDSERSAASSSSLSTGKDKTSEYRKEASDLVELLLTHCVQHDSASVRKWGLECIKILLQWVHLEQVWRDLINYVLRFGAAIQSDKTQLAVAVSRLLSEKESTKIQDRFVQIVTDETKCEQIRLGFVDLCAGVNAYVFDKLVPHIKTLLDSNRRSKFLSSFIKTYDGSLNHIDVVEQCLNCEQTVKILLRKWTAAVFDNMDLTSRKKLFSLMIGASVKCETAEVKVAIQKTVRKWTLDTTIINAELESCLLIQRKQALGGNTSGRRSSQGAELSNVDTTVDWVSRTEAVLEFAQSGKRLKRKTKLIKPLFMILKICIAMEEQTPVEYLKQLMLTSLTIACEEEETEDVKSNMGDWVYFQVDSVIECLRCSRNPQTHHHALILLNFAAKRFPEQVLHGVMSLFTFMGSSILRQDDAYSTQLIQQTVVSIIPTLAQSGGAQQYQRSLVSAGIYRVFTSAVQDIPIHRRVPIFKSLVEVMDPVESMWQICFIIVDEALMGQNKKNVLKSDLELARNVLWSFDSEKVLQTLEKMYMYLSELPIYDKKRNGDFAKCKSTQSAWSKSVIDLSRKQCLREAQLVINFSLELIAKTLTKFENSEEKSQSFETLLEKCLSFSRQLSTLQDDKVFRLIANRNFEIIDKVNAVLDPKDFVQTVRLILEKDDISIKKRILDIFNQRVMHHVEWFGDPLILLEILPTLLSCGSLDMNQEEVIPLIQTAFLSLKLLARHLALKSPDDFIPVFELSYENARNKNKLLASSALLCLSELFCLKSLILPKLQDVTKSIQRAFKHAAKSVAVGDEEEDEGGSSQQEQQQHESSNKNEEVSNVANNLLLVSGMTALNKFVEHLGSFMGTNFLTKSLVSVLSINAKIFGEGEKADNRRKTFDSKLKLLCKTVAGKIPLRNSLPSIRKVFVKLGSNQDALVVLLKLLRDSIVGTEKQDFNTLLPGLFDTFLNDFLVYRSSRVENDDAVEQTNSEGIAVVEDAVIECLISGIVLKLSEGVFRPFYHRVYDWAGDSLQRKITFYRLSGYAAERLKSLFVTFAGYVIGHAAESLGESVELTKAILHYFYHIFVNDREGFVTSERFNTLAKPLVDLIETQPVIDGIIPIKDLNSTLVQLAVATNDLNRWQHLIELVSYKSQHVNSKVRLFTISTLEAVANELEKDFLPLLPPAVPFLADLLGDDDDVVEKETKKMLVKLEAIVGEPLQPYFSA